MKLQIIFLLISKLFGLLIKNSYKIDKKEITDEKLKILKHYIKHDGTIESFESFFGDFNQETFKMKYKKTKKLSFFRMVPNPFLLVISKEKKNHISGFMV